MNRHLKLFQIQWLLIAEKEKQPFKSPIHRHLNQLLCDS